MNNGKLLPTIFALIFAAGFLVEFNHAYYRWLYLGGFILASLLYVYQGSKK